MKFIRFRIGQASFSNSPKPQALNQENNVCVLDFYTDT